MKNSIPKYAIAQTAPDRAWGMVRLRGPVILMELAPSEGQPGLMGPTFTPWLWPSDVFDLGSRHKIEDSLTKMWHIYAEFEECGGRVAMYHIDPERPLPRWMVLDHDRSDWTAVLDTRDGCLWTVEDDLAALEWVPDWRLHPDREPVMEFPRSTREVMAFWKQFLADHDRIEAEEDFFH